MPSVLAGAGRMKTLCYEIRYPRFYIQAINSLCGAIFRGLRQKGQAVLLWRVVLADDGSQKPAVAFNLASTTSSRICNNAACFEHTAKWPLGLYHAYYHRARSPETYHTRVGAEKGRKYHQRSSILRGSDRTLPVTLGSETDHPSTY